MVTLPNFYRSAPMFFHPFHILHCRDYFGCLDHTFYLFDSIEDPIDAHVVSSARGCLKMD
jgi:hypothetical protein